MGITIEKTIPPSKIVLVNPPYKSKVLRDNFCSHSSKADYVWPPVDLLYLSGHLRNSGHNPTVIDAIATGQNWDDMKRLLTDLQPTVIILLSSSLTIKSDLNGFSEVTKNLTQKTLLGVIGNIAYFEPELVSKHFQSVDFAIKSFIWPSIHYLKNLESTQRIIINSLFLNDATKPLSPQHDLFPIAKYSIPSAQKYPLTTMLTAEGCPHTCQFCVASEIKLKTRPLNDLKFELDQIVKNGIREIFFLDSTFNANLNFLGEFLDLLRGYNLSWSANIHCSKVTKDLLVKMKLAGCHTVNIGIESGNQKILNKYAPSKSLERLKVVFKLTHELKMDTLGYAIIGFPEESNKDILRTIDFVKQLNPTFASFSLLIPDHGTKLFDSLIANKTDILPMDHSTSQSWTHDSFLTTKKERERLIRHAYISFYLRPRKIIYLIKKYPLREMIRNAFFLIWKYSKI